MDVLRCDAYTSYSDVSSPRTPSPRSDDFAPPLPVQFKVEYEPVANIFAMSDEHTVAPEGHSMWQGVAASPLSLPFNNSRGSLLQELYDQDINSHHAAPQEYVDHHAEQMHLGHEWNHQTMPNVGQPFQHQHQHQQQSHQHQPQQDMTSMRRATYPYVRQDRDDSIPYSLPSSFLPRENESFMGPFSSRPDSLYNEPLPMSDQSPHLFPLHSENSFLPTRFDLSSSVSSSPASSLREFDSVDPHVKLEENAPVIVPSQSCLYPHPSSSPMHPVTYLSPHTGLPVRHTDDASSKETPTLRRRCFNCSQTEPPSWRRSTLNPGKIVCNKCGLYERTHLRPRPLRFDELRTGNKSRKQLKAVPPGSPASKPAPIVKKEVDVRDVMPRRASVSSSSGSVHSSSDWDDSVSVYSSTGSGPPSSFNSPALTSFSLPHEPRSSQSPPHDGGIRLPNTPLSDIASFQAGHPMPRKSATTPDYGSPSLLSESFRRSSLSDELTAQHDLNGWSSVSREISGSPGSVTDGHPILA